MPGPARSAVRSGPLTRAEVVSTALRLLEGRDLDSLSMRSVAGALGVTPMALYRHVRDRDDLLAGMCDAVLSELEPVEAEDPEEQLFELAEQLVTRLEGRRGLVAVLACAPVSETSLLVTEEVLALLRSTGRSAGEARRVFGAWFGLVLGYALIGSGPAGFAADARVDGTGGAERADAVALWRDRPAGDLREALRRLLGPV